MEKRTPQIAILNLTGELSPEFSRYFSSRNILVVNPLTSSDVYDWSHILTRDIHDFSLINKTYEVTQKERNIISLSKVKDLQNFTINNGNLILDDTWFEGPMGSFIMDKYLQSYGAISLSDNYPSFSEIGSFVIANPFNTGEYLDRMVQKAFESGTDALTVKTYFDHLVMYVAGLKTKGKAGLPFEVTYGVFEDIFAVQVNFFAKELTVMDISTSLSSAISKKAEEYYLNVAVQASDFFDFSFMPEVNKVVVTSLWTKDERIQFENRGLMFASLVGGIPLALYQNEGTTSSLISSLGNIQDNSDKVKIADHLSDDVVNSLVSGFKEAGEQATRVSGGERTEDETRIIRGEEDILQEIAKTVKGKFEEDKSVVKISGDRIDVEKVAFTIASKVDESTKEKNLQVRSLYNHLPASIKTGLFDFAKGLNKEVDYLSDSDLDMFQLQKVPEILRAELMRVTSLENAKRASESDAGLKQAEAKLATSLKENEKLKNQLRVMASEVKVLKESRNKIAEMKMKAAQVSSDISVAGDTDEELRKSFVSKLNDQKSLNETDQKKLASLLERESKLISDLKQEEMKGRKIQLEATQKETFFQQEIEKAERQIKGKDLVILKTKETLTKLIEKKDQTINDLNSKIDVLVKASIAGQGQHQAQTIRDLEKQNQNLNRQLEVYKNKITALSSNMASTKSEDSFKDEVRKLQMLNQQTKNQLDLAKKEMEKLQTRLTHEGTQISHLKLEKMKLEEQLKKAESKSGPSQVANSQQDTELKRMMLQNQILESQIKESESKVATLEAKLVEAIRPAKGNSGDEGSKVKLSQLENSVKKLTQDLLENKSQLSEAKKETNKLRQEKTALQNQLDKLKKEADKAKPATPKKSGKAA